MYDQLNLPAAVYDLLLGVLVGEASSVEVVDGQDLIASLELSLGRTVRENLGEVESERELTTFVISGDNSEHPESSIFRLSKRIREILSEILQKKMG